MERGYVSRDRLRSWTIEKSLLVFRAVLNWTAGEIYFEENTPPPSDRLLVAMSAASLIEMANVDLTPRVPQPPPIQSAPVTYNTMKYICSHRIFAPAAANHHCPILPIIRADACSRSDEIYDCSTDASETHA